MGKQLPEPNALNDVKEFHDTFDLPVLSEPTIPDAKRCTLRINLIEEELQELKDAITAGDLVEVVDAFCDIQYVLSGAILEFGLGDKFKTLFEEVQRSNMSKKCKTHDVALRTQEHYKQKDGTESNIVERNNEYIVYRNTDGKVLKSVEYSEANLSQFL